MAQLTYRDAVAAGIAQEMRRDPNVVLLGEDVAAAGGVFKATVGLLDEFGAKRVKDTPISEQAIVGAAMGAAMTGLRPIVDLMFSDFFAVTWDIVANQIAKTRYMTDGQVTLPLVIRSANGAGSRFGAQHSQSVENWSMMIPGLKIVAPAFPGDVKGLLAAAIRSDDPVMFFEQKSLYATKGEVPDGEHVIELGKANVLREGKDVTIVALALMVPRALKAAEILKEQHGIDATVIDLRSLVPLDTQTILREVGEDGPARHGRREPAALRLGRRDRLDRRRGAVLGSRRPRSCASRRRTCRSRPRTTSRTRNCRRPSASSPACASSSTKLARRGLDERIDAAARRDRHRGHRRQLAQEGRRHGRRRRDHPRHRDRQGLDGDSVAGRRVSSRRSSCRQARPSRSAPCSPSSRAA